MTGFTVKWPAGDDELSRAIEQATSETLIGMAADRSIPENAQRQLARHGDLKVRTALAENAAASAATQQDLWESDTSKVESVRIALAGNQALVPALQKRILRSSNPLILAGLAGNVDARSEKATRFLARSDKPFVRVVLAVKEGRRADSTVAVALARDENVLVRLVMARIVIHAEAAAILACNLDEAVRQKAPGRVRSARPHPNTRRRSRSAATT